MQYFFQVYSAKKEPTFVGSQIRTYHVAPHEAVPLFSPEPDDICKRFIAL